MKKAEQDWPALPLGEWESTYRNVAQVDPDRRKNPLGFAPLLTIWWNVALYVTHEDDELNDPLPGRRV